MAWLYFFASNSYDPQNSYEHQYQSPDLIHPERKVVIEYVFSIPRKELEKKYSGPKKPEPEGAYVSIRKVSLFCHFRKDEKDSPTKKHV